MRYIIIFILLNLILLTTAFTHHHHDGDSSSDSADNSDSNGYPSFKSGDILITDPSALYPSTVFEFTTDGDSVYNYSTQLEKDPSTTCFPVDIGFLDDSTLLLLDGFQGIFYSSMDGKVKGIWNNLSPKTANLPGCSQSKLTVDNVNNLIYVASSNLNCDYNYVPGIFVLSMEGKLLYTLENSEFNTTTGIYGDSNGNIWITDINEIFIYNINQKTYKTIDPIGKDKIAYNGIIIENNDVYVSVPSYQGDMIVQLNLDGSLVRAIKMIGYFDGTTSGYPSSLALTKNHIYVEVPYASKKEKPPGSSSSGSDSDSSFEGYFEFELSSNSQKVDVVQAYELADGSFYKSWGGHSCKEENILCIPYRGFVIVP
ncbi:hypothetical protein DICPUDRAFT_153743 [Dictyostelium purpureum]|uniref:SMP-30/Gluconolactonase/LRE-like region domain-containing protein n=1 Tax=Dictyostelium purpureum TaxID=5786 RepID=F0ZPN2_DICPU|nr:uncharacterized protein DICPUDRAFT_153743 [Dictyostelium purpureum]EGC34091.1 hypothetical protein DICPUDRAFT_153743 [Dictyostelium purpureum]|eukprot:XP_003289384.1 hypothetical protein DICPUDRAFT_153743 [Dictyostelium purpureum]